MIYLICAKDGAQYFWRNWTAPDDGNEWIEVRKMADLESVVADIKPDALFFTHWNIKVIPEITNNYLCVNLHPADLPWGRGPSPIQNSILQGITETMHTAHLMNEEYDAGDILHQWPISLLGGGDEIFDRLGKSSAWGVHYVAENLEKLVANRTPQGECTQKFERRFPEDSDIGWSYMRALHEAGLPKVFNFIRMLDAENYPPAYLNSGNFRYTFTNAVMRPDGIEAHVKITEVNE